jgi:DNA-directed RNA polymerase specialized sigma subunit
MEGFYMTLNDNANPEWQDDSTSYRIGGRMATDTRLDYWDRMKADADKRAQEVIELYRQKRTYKEIAEKVGVSFQRVGHIIKRAKDRGLIENLDNRRKSA